MIRFKIDSNEHRTRLDLAVVTHVPALSRSFIARLCDDSRVMVNGTPQKSGYKLKEGDIVRVDYDMKELEAVPDIDIPIIYEDDDCIVVSKPEGVLSHARGKFWNEASVASFIRRKIMLSGERGGIVHRLDRATSGVMICAKHEQALSYLQKQFADRTTVKRYCALVSGIVEPQQAIIDIPIDRNPKKPQTFRAHANGKTAQTTYKVVKQGNDCAELLLEPHTGRTHQLRVHLAYQHHPIIGDTLYDGVPADRLYLHAYELSIVLPSGKPMTFKSDIPDSFKTYLDAAHG